MSALQNSAMLVSLNITAWSARKHDKSVSDKVDQDNGAKNAGRYNKLLIKKEALEPLNQISSAARTFLYSKTLPWGENGERLLPASLFIEFKQEMYQYECEFETRTHDFVRLYPAAVVEAKERLGALYDSKDYPAASEIRERFSFSMSVLPVPSARDFRVELSEGHVDAIKRDIERQMEARQKDAVKDCYARVRTVVSAMHDRLKDKKTVFRDTLISNAQDLLQILPDLNVTNDPDLTKIAADLRAILVPPDRLRADEVLRRETAKKAQDIVDKMRGW